MKMTVGVHWEMAGKALKDWAIEIDRDPCDAHVPQLFRSSSQNPSQSRAGASPFSETDSGTSF